MDKNGDHSGERLIKYMMTVKLLTDDPDNPTAELSRHASSSPFPPFQRGDLIALQSNPAKAYEIVNSSHMIHDGVEALIMATAVFIKESNITQA